MTQIEEMPPVTQKLVILHRTLGHWGNLFYCSCGSMKKAV